MWSVNWISKSEIEELPLSSGQRAVSRDFFSENEQLEDYLLLCADANKFYLIEFTKSDNRDGYQMKIITEKKIGVPFMFRVSSNSLRFSISVKLEGAPIVVAALQHGSLIVVVHVCRYNGHYLLTHREVNLGYNSILVGMDAFVSSSQGGKFIEILALNVNPASIEFIKLKMTKTLQLAC